MDLVQKELRKALLWSVSFLVAGYYLFLPIGILGAVLLVPAALGYLRYRRDPEEELRKLRNRRAKQFAFEHLNSREGVQSLTPKQKDTVMDRGQSIADSVDDGLDGVRTGFGYLKRGFAGLFGAFICLVFIFGRTPLVQVLLAIGGLSLLAFSTWSAVKFVQLLQSASRRIEDGELSRMKNGIEDINRLADGLVEERVGEVATDSQFLSAHEREQLSKPRSKKVADLAVFLAIGIAITALGLVLRSASQPYDGGVTTEATVVEVAETGRGDDRRYVATYEFTLENGSTVNFTFGSSPTAKRVGKTIEISYLRSDPAGTVRDLNEYKVLGWFARGIGVVVLFIALSQVPAAFRRPEVMNTTDEPECEDKQTSGPSQSPLMDTPPPLPSSRPAPAPGRSFADFPAAADTTDWD